MSYKRNIEGLIWNIENGNFETLRKLIPNFTFKDLLERFENNNNLIHYIFSSCDSEIILLFTNRLSELLKRGDISLMELRELLETQNDGGFTPIDRILQEEQGDPAVTISELFKGMFNVVILEETLKAEGQDGDIYTTIDGYEDYQNRKDEIIENARLGIESHDLSYDYYYAFISSESNWYKRRALVEKYLKHRYEDDSFAKLNITKVAYALHDANALVLYLLMNQYQHIVENDASVLNEEDIAAAALALDPSSIAPTTLLEYTPYIFPITSAIERQP